ncbi:archaeal type cofactor-independent phosphoglycerate mutase, partial [Haematococcus lacustris]
MPRKASTICDALTTGSAQFGFVHVKAVDDCGHDRRLQMKVMFQEVVDVMLGQMVRRL